MQEQDYILLLSKQFSDELSPVEADALQEWLDQSPDNMQEAAAFRQVWQQAGTYNPVFQPDLAADFRKVQARIQQAPPQVRIIPIGRRLLRIAAMLAFLALAFWTYRSFNGAPVAQLSASAKGLPKQEVLLPDGTRVWLREGSVIDYPTAFSGQERRVKLLGEAYFDVAHLAGQPFQVELPDGGLIEVMGTQFDVCQGEKQNSVLVRSGRVRFYTNKQGRKIVLNPGDKAVYQLSENTVEESKVSTFNELAWQAGGLEFVKTPLSTVITDLEKYYQVKIVMRNNALRTCLHTAPLTTQPLEKVLQSLSLTYQLKVLHTTPGLYELVGGTCR